MEATALVDALKRVLKARGLTYADIAAGLGLSEASVKRIFSRRDFTLVRVDEICRIAGVDFADLARAASEDRPGAASLTLEQETAIVSEPKLLLVALCAVNNWTFDEIVATYALSVAECTRLLVRLDRLRIVELAPGNRIRPMISRTFSWRPGGPIQRYFHARIQDEYLASRFDRPDELFVFVSGMLSHASSAELIARLRRVARDFAEQHRDDRRSHEHPRGEAERRKVAAQARRVHQHEPVDAMPRELGDARDDLPARRVTDERRPLHRARVEQRQHGVRVGVHVLPLPGVRRVAAARQIDADDAVTLRDLGQDVLKMGEAAHEPVHEQEDVALALVEIDDRPRRRLVAPPLVGEARVRIRRGFGHSLRDYALDAKK
jgi:transcriptional regulator with XRE-family HTH domain